MTLAIEREKPNNMLEGRSASTYRKETGTMREIKFRGKRVDNGKWAFGFLVIQSDGSHFIYLPTRYGEWLKVDPKTVGQYIGLKDQNSKEIYEGDILDVDGTPWLVEPIGTEERDGGKFGLCASPYGSGEAYFIDKSILDGKVIGNIYENPELLKGEKTA